jgi:outer membrane lipoprotein-sorting protein
MKNTLPLLALGFFLLSGSHAFAMSAQEIVARADERRGPDGSFSFNVRVKDYSGKALVQENVYKVHSKDMKYTLVETIFPERLAGRKLLMAGQLWLYLPTLRRPTRVGTQQRLTGEVANGDIARAKFSVDYSAKLEGKEMVKGVSHYRLLLTARDKAAAYRKVRLWVSEKEFFPLKAEFYALSGKKLKTGEYTERETVLGNPRMTGLVIRDAITPSKQSHLKYYNYRRETLDDQFFNKESLAD